ncbi:MAG: pilin [Candidatus Doudnabacteria bacterium]|nr:pilin [Candidatus Doudnabacteria bacterium]
MKNKLIIFFLAIAILLTPVFSLAQSSQGCTNNPQAQLCNPIRTSDSLIVFIFRLIQVFTTFFAFMALVYVVFSGFRMVVSQGDSEALTVAKSAFMWAIFGLILGMFAFVLISATGEYIGVVKTGDTAITGNNLPNNPLMDDTFYQLLVRMLTGFLSVAGLISILMIVIGGFRYITAQGNEEMAESGKKTLQWAIIGLVIILLAYVIVRSTLTFFGNK